MPNMPNPAVQLSVILVCASVAAALGPCIERQNIATKGIKTAFRSSTYPQRRYSYGLLVPRKSNDFKSIEDSIDVKRSLLRFSLDLTGTFLRIRPSGNLALSPFSIATALSLMLRGSDGNTFQELWRILRLGPLSISPSSDEFFHQQFSQLLLTLTTETDGASIAVANAVFIQRGFPIHSGFVSSTRCYYGSSVEQVDFYSDPIGTRETINTWVNEHTDGHLKQFLAEPPDSTTNLMLVNAVYFNGAWETPFQTYFTREQEFTINSQEKILIPLMVSVNEYMYTESEALAATAVALPYTNGEVTMYLLLPNEPGEEGLEALENRLSYSSLLEILQSLKKTRVSIHIPRMRIDQRLSLTEGFRLLGLASATNMSRLSSSPELSLNEAIHHTVIDVTEQGTRASAATAVSLNREGTTKSFRADRPFFLFIRHEETQVLLFWARVVRPRSAPGFISRTTSSIFSSHKESNRYKPISTTTSTTEPAPTPHMWNSPRGEQWFIFN